MKFVSSIPLIVSREENRSQEPGARIQYLESS